MRTQHKTRESTKTVYLERINRAIDHVVSHLAEPLRLEEVARAAHISPFHFHRVFRALVGETLADFVKRLRLERALVLMAHSPRSSLTTIALDCGFASSSDFSRSFKQKFGAAPSTFDIRAWRDSHLAELTATTRAVADRAHVDRLPPRSNPDAFRARLREIPARTVAYIRVDNPYRTNAVLHATQRLTAWAERHSFADRQWLGYQWDNPEITSLDKCRYYIAVEAERFTPKGEIGRFTFPPMLIAEVEIRGDIHLELRALEWIYRTWLPRSGYVPDDQPCFEAWIGRPFAHGIEHFELHGQLPIKRG